MKRRAAIVGAILAWALLAQRPSLWALFSSNAKFAFTASATTSGGTAAPPAPPAATAFAISVSALPANALFGTNVVVPVTITSDVPLDPANVTASMLYQVQPNGGFPGPVSSTPKPIIFSRDRANPNAVVGNAIIPGSDPSLSPIQNANGGTFTYIFVAQLGALSAMRTAAGQFVSGPVTTLPPGAYSTNVTGKICQVVDPALVNTLTVTAPDLFVSDGQTSVTFDPAAITGPGNLCIAEENPESSPFAPGGAMPAAVYSVTLEGASLVQTARLVLSYPTNQDGKLINMNASATDLAIYWLGPENLPPSAQTWHILGRPQIDTTLHTVSGTTAHLSTFALFAGAPIGGADLRPAERIITPNGDGHNDAAHFGSVDEVKIFDVRGRRIRTIAGPSPIWDGTNDSGAIVESGVYIYQFTVNGDRVSGVIGVAK